MLVKGLPHPSLACSTLTRAFSISHKSNTKNQFKLPPHIATLAKKPSLPLSLIQIYSHHKHRHLTAEFLHNEVPIRLAKLAKALTELPSGMSQEERVKSTVRGYVHAIDSLVRLDVSTGGVEDKVHQFLRGWTSNADISPRSSDRSDYLNWRSVRQSVRSFKSNKREPGLRLIEHDLSLNSIKVAGGKADNFMTPIQKTVEDLVDKIRGDKHTQQTMTVEADKELLSVSMKMKQNADAAAQSEIEVSERSERALRKTRIFAMDLAKWLQT